MSNFAANDFADIAARMRALKCEAVEAAPKTPWWCADCQREVDGREVTYQERHDERAGGCGCDVYPSCETCSNKGWCDETLGGYPLSPWCECPDCHNPFAKPSP